MPKRTQDLKLSEINVEDRATIGPYTYKAGKKAGRCPRCNTFRWDWVKDTKCQVCGLIPLASFYRRGRY